MSSIRCVSGLPISKEHPCKKVTFILPENQPGHQSHQGMPAEPSQTAKSICLPPSLEAYTHPPTHAQRTTESTLLTPGTPALIPVTRFRVKKGNHRPTTAAGPLRCGSTKALQREQRTYFALLGYRRSRIFQYGPAHRVSVLLQHCSRHYWPSSRGT